jgi:ribonuclease Z
VAGTPHITTGRMGRTYNVMPPSLDVISDLDEVMHVALCGASGLMPSDNRSGPCVAVIANSKMFIIDVGVAGSSNLTRMGLNRGATEGVFLTHFYSDHIGGL